MSDVTLLLSFFLFVMGVVVCLGGLWLWRLESTGASSSEMLDRPETGWRAQLIANLRLLGEAFPNPVQSPQALRKNLIAAGYRHPSAPSLFYGSKWAAALLIGLPMGWVGLIDRQDPSIAVLLCLCGLGFGFLLPDRILEGQVSRRAERLEQALPASLDLLVLSVEAGQPLDTAIFETSRELRDLFPELSAEFGQVQLELRAGRSRAEVLRDLGQRTSSVELKKLAAVLVDTDRFGTSLAPALRTHARYLRTTRRHTAQEAARKLGVKLIFPVFFLVMPSVFVVTLGPAVIQIYRNISTFKFGD